MTPSEMLRDEVADDWQAATDHAFTRALVDGTLPDVKMAGYLQQDYHFIDAFVRLLAAAVAEAPSLPDRVPGAQFLALVTGPENTYFQRSLAALGVPEDAPMAPETCAFLDLMTEARTSGEYGRMIAVLCVAEWVYLSWAAPHEDRAKALPFHLGEWITLHAGPGFEGVVAYLREQLDTLWPGLGAEAQDRTRTAFHRAIVLERAFFDVAWTGFPVAR